MKKLLSLLALIVLLTGCNEQVLQTITEKIDETEIDETAQYTETINEETDMYVIDIEYPQWKNLDTLNDLVAKEMYDEIGYFKDSLPEFVDEEWIDLEDEMKSGLYIDYEIYNNNWDYLSIGFTNYTYYEGAAHGFSYTIPFNLDFGTFEQIQLADIFINDTDYISALSEMAIPELKGKLLESEWQDDPWIEEGAGPDSVNFSAYTLTDRSIIFHFDPYQVAAYAAGPQQAEFTFSELYALLNPKWAALGELEE